MGPDPPTSSPVLPFYLSQIAAVAMSLSLGFIVATVAITFEILPPLQLLLPTCHRCSILSLLNQSATVALLLHFVMIGVINLCPAHLSQRLSQHCRVAVMNSLSHRSSQHAIWCRLVLIVFPCEDSSNLLATSVPLPHHADYASTQILPVLIYSNSSWSNMHHSCAPAGSAHTLSATLFRPISRLNPVLNRFPANPSSTSLGHLHKLPSCNAPVSLAIRHT